MMQRRSKLIIAFYLVLFANVAFAQGREIVVALHDGRELRGELASVRDSTFVLLVKDSQFVVISDSHVRTLTVKGTSHYPLWLGIGTLAGVVSGAVIGSQVAFFDPSYGATIGGAVGAGGGILVGALIGAATSTKDSVIIDLTPKGFSNLRSLSHFPENEPEYLRALK